MYVTCNNLFILFRSNCSFNEECVLKMEEEEVLNNHYCCLVLLSRLQQSA